MVSNMSDLTEVHAYFAVAGSTYRAIKIDVEGKTPDEIATKLDEEFDGVSMCHQCSPECESPEGELNGFRIGDVDYEYRNGRWMQIP